MAMRHQQVDKAGRYTSNGSQEASRIAYITMIQVRRRPTIGEEERDLFARATLVEL